MRNIEELNKILHNLPCGCIMGITIGEAKLLRDSGNLVNHDDNRSPESTKWKLLGLAKYWNSVHDANNLQKTAEKTPSFTYHGGSLTPFLFVEETKSNRSRAKNFVFKIADGGHRDNVQENFYNNETFPEIPENEWEDLQWYVDNLMGKSISTLDDEIIDEITETIMPITFLPSQDKKARILANEGLKMSYQQKLRYGYSDNPLWLAIHDSCNSSIRRSFVLNTNCQDEQEVPEALWVLGRLMGISKKKPEIPEYLLRWYKNASKEDIENFVEVFEDFYDNIFTNPHFDFLRAKGGYKMGPVSGLFYSAQMYIDEGSVFKKEYLKARKNLKEEKREAFGKITFKNDFLGKNARKDNIQVLNNRIWYAQQTLNFIKKNTKFFEDHNATIHSSLNDIAVSQGTSKANFGTTEGKTFKTLYEKYSLSEVA